jgi:hypothetical protein
MNDKLAVNFVSVSKPKDRTPILSRRSKLISYLDRQLANVHSFKSGSQTGPANQVEMWPIYPIALYFNCGHHTGRF